VKKLLITLLCFSSMSVIAFSEDSICKGDTVIDSGDLRGTVVEIEIQLKDCKQETTEQKVYYQNAAVKFIYNTVRGIF
jgi:hypothetical protein